MVKHKKNLIIGFAIILLILHLIKFFYFNEKISTLILGTSAIVLLLIAFIKKEKKQQ